MAMLAQLVNELDRLMTQIVQSDPPQLCPVLFAWCKECESLGKKCMQWLALLHSIIRDLLELRCDALLSCPRIYRLSCRECAVEVKQYNQWLWCCLFHNVI